MYGFLVKGCLVESKSLGLTIFFLLVTLGQLRSSSHQAVGNILSVENRATLDYLMFFSGVKTTGRQGSTPQHVHAPPGGNPNTHQEQLVSSNNWEWVSQWKPKETRENVLHLSPQFKVVYLICTLGSSRLWRSTKVTVLLLLKHTVELT